MWPLSTPSYPKHLLRINGQTESLLQQTYKRVEGLADTVYVITEAGHAHHVQEQLPKLDEGCLIVEPGRRGTANCMLAALTAIEKKHDADEPIFILWADHYIRDIEGFEQSIKHANQLAEAERRIVLIGIEPDHPATCFGYIQKGSILPGNNLAYNVHSFKEKPSFNIAKRYLWSGEYLWNCGYFIASANTFKHAMEQYAPELLESYQTLVDAESFEEAYLSLNSHNIDNALIEKVQDLLVVRASFDWIDLGSYEDMHKVMDTDEAGNHVAGEEVELEGVENSFVQNHEDKPVVVIGLDNVVVVNTKDGILVTRKDVSQKVGEVSKKIKPQ